MAASERQGAAAIERFIGHLFVRYEVNGCLGGSAAGQHRVTLSVSEVYHPKRC